MLTERLIRDAKPKPKTRIIWDSQVKGLGLRITPGAVKAFILNYRTAGRLRRATIGRYPAIGLRAARERAGAELAGIRAGEADPLERQREAREAPTVAEGLDRFFGKYAPARQAIGRMAPKTVEEYGYQARSIIRPALGDRKVADVTRRHVERMIEPLPRVQRNRTMALTSRLFTLFESWGWRPQHTNPVRGIERAREEPRDRVTDALRARRALHGVGRPPGDVRGVGRGDPVRGRHGTPDRGGPGGPVGARRLRGGPADAAGDEDGTADAPPAGAGPRHPAPPAPHTRQPLGVHYRPVARHL